MDDLRRRDLVEKLGAVTEAEAARLPRLRCPTGRTAEDRVDLHRPDSKLAGCPLSVLRVGREHRCREPVNSLVSLLQRLVERRDDLDGGDGSEGLLVHHRHAFADTGENGWRIEEPGTVGQLAAAP